MLGNSGDGFLHPLSYNLRGDYLYNFQRLKPLLFLWGREVGREGDRVELGGKGKAGLTGVRCY